MSTASCPLAVCRPTTEQWIHPRYPYLLPVKVLRDVFRGKFVAALRRAHRRGELEFHGKLQCLARPQDIRRLASATLSPTTGLPTPNLPSEGPSTLSATSAATRIGLRSPTAAWCHLPTARSRSAGETGRTRTRSDS